MKTFVQLSLLLLTLHLTAQKIPLSEANVIADHPMMAARSAMLFNGELKENSNFPSDKIAVPEEEVIPGSGLKGQVLIIDLKGTVTLKEICLYDTYGQSELKVYTALDIMQPTLLSELTLDSYLKWKKIRSDRQCRYIMLNNPDGAISGIGEIEVFGKQNQAAAEVTLNTAKASAPGNTRPIRKIWGVNTHDYDHVPSRPDLNMYNIADINPLPNERTYAEFHKNIRKGEMLFRNPSPGGISHQDVNEMRARGGKIMFTMLGPMPEFADTYPEEARNKKDLPWVYWDKKLSYEQNRERLYDPQTYAPMRDYLMAFVEEFKEDSDIIIAQWTNEIDKTWRDPYHRLNANMVAAMYSMLWDGHEGRYGKGIKDIAPAMEVAWAAQAYHNLGYTKMAEAWFKKNRNDGKFCADIISVNAYCNSRSGFQHSPDATAIPPEGTLWLQRIREFSEFAHNRNMQFALTEFGADHSGVSVNSVWVNQEEREDAAKVRAIKDRKAAAEYYDEHYYPKWRDELLQIQAAWDLRYLLEATPYADYLFLYHIRDIHKEGSANMGTYASSGISFNHRIKGQGSLELKPNGVAIRDFYNALKDYHFVEREQRGDTITMTFENEAGKRKKVRWTTAHDSMPEILP